MRDTTADYFLNLLKQDSGMKLLRSHSAHLTISFLYNAFREEHVQSIPSDQLESKLALFLQAHQEDEHLMEEEAEETVFVPGQNELFADFQTKAHVLVTFWCSDDRAYLRRYSLASGVFVVELTAGIERLFSWIENSEPAEFVGTESRFQNILLRLRDLKENTQEAPAERIAALKEQKKKIDEQIKKIELTGVPQMYTEVQIKERLEGISRDSRELLGDFRQAEDNFRAILQEIYREQGDMQATRGSILGYTLDTNHALRVSPQGQSFSSFWNFISQDTDDEINSLINAILSAAENQNVVWSDDFLLHLKQYLYDAGHKIIEQNRVLSDRISRILSTQEAGSRYLIRQLTAGIKKEMVTYLERIDGGAESPGRDFLFVEGKPGLSFPQARTPVLDEQTNTMEEMKPFNAQAIDSASLKALFNQFYVDEKELLKTADAFRAEKNGMQFTLAELMQKYPVKKGLAEVVTWFAVAEHDDRMKVESEKNDEIEFTRNGTRVKVTVPRMLFI
jgi:hypothetical protein